jgi:hypothetical protein
MNFAPQSKKVCERADETGHAFLTTTLLLVFLSLQVALQPDCLRLPCCFSSPPAKIRGENAVAPTHQLRSRALGL